MCLRGLAGDKETLKGMKKAVERDERSSDFEEEFDDDGYPYTDRTIGTTVLENELPEGNDADERYDEDGEDPLVNRTIDLVTSESDDEIAEQELSDWIHKRKRKSAPQPTTSKQSKKAKTASSTTPSTTSATRPTRLLLQWRRREIGNGEIEVSDDYNVGYIEFLDTACTRFKGKISITFAGDDLPFEGYRFSDTHSLNKGKWTDYSERAHEAGRWGRW